MNLFHTRETSPQDVKDHHGSHGGHRWMMIACCVPMLGIAIALVVLGVVSPAFVVIAIICTAAMALMMGGMSHGGGGGKN